MKLSVHTTNKMYVYSVLVYEQCMRKGRLFTLLKTNPFSEPNILYISTGLSFYGCLALNTCTNFTLFITMKAYAMYRTYQYTLLQVLCRIGSQASICHLGLIWPFSKVVSQSRAQHAASVQETCLQWSFIVALWDT